MLPTNVLETKMLLANSTVAPAPVEGAAKQAEQSIDPATYKGDLDVFGILGVVAGAYAIIYGFKLLERKLS